MRKSKNRYFYHIFVSPGDAPGSITLNVVWMEREFDAYKLSRTLGRKSSIFHTPFYSTPPLRGFPSEYCHPVWCGKTRMVWLPDGEKNSKMSLFVFVQLTNVTDRQTDRRTDGQTDTASRHIPRLCIASRGNKTAKIFSLPQGSWI